MKQLTLDGIIKKRPGPKRTQARGCNHEARERVNARFPLHITLKLFVARGSMRHKAVLKLLKTAIQRARVQGLAIQHFSLQHDHVHFIVESRDNSTLTRGMRALSISLAMRLNVLWRSHGARLKQRYHLHVLKTLRQVRHALSYLRHNHIKHSGVFSQREDDFFASFALSTLARTAWLDPPRSWLQLKGMTG
jgi:REP element-mobilizing transposase RayT